MREILFRGKAKETNYRYEEGEWIYGNLAKMIGTDGEDKLCIQPWERDAEGVNSVITEVVSETVGQYTGLTDKNGRKIFEGDIVRCTDRVNDYDFTAVVQFGNPNALYSWGFQLKQISGEKANTDILLWVEMEDSGAYIEIIGNVWDNPELLNNDRIEHDSLCKTETYKK